MFIELPLIKGHYLAYVLDEECRKQLMFLSPPIFKNVICHHVTIAYDYQISDLPKIAKVIEKSRTFELVDHIVGDGVECYTARIGGYHRPDGRQYHLTASFKDGRCSADSNKLIDSFRHEIFRPMNFTLSGEFMMLPKTPR